jgi:hypothetical protein
VTTGTSKRTNRNTHTNADALLSWSVEIPHRCQCEGGGICLGSGPRVCQVWRPGACPLGHQLGGLCVISPGAIPPPMAAFIRAAVEIVMISLPCSCRVNAVTLAPLLSVWSRRYSRALGCRFSELCWGCCVQATFVCGPVKNEPQKRHWFSRKTHSRSDGLNKFSEVGPNGQNSMAFAECLKFALGCVL